MKRTIFGLSAAALAALTVASTANAELKHRYSFTSDASDSVGGANGVVVNPSGAFATFAGGQLSVAANTGQGSNQDFSLPATQGAYVDLPNGIISALGTRATFEAWVTVETNRNWAEIYAFGTSNNGENTAVGAGNSRYITLIPQNGQNSRLRYTHRGTPGNAENGVDGPATLAAGVEQHLVTTWDENDLTAGANGTGYLYLNGTLLGAVALRSDIRLSNLGDVNNWLGRSQWPDSLFDGSYNEFRIYDSAFTPADALLSFVQGPNAVPEPGMFALGAVAAVGALARRRRAR